jgi:subtilase family serine protease
MKANSFKLPAVALILTGGMLASVAIPAMAQSVPQIIQPVNDSNLTTLTNNVHPLAKAQYDQGEAPDSTPTGMLILTLKRSPAQENALQQFLIDAHTKGTSSYHKWLTPAQFGEKYGPDDSDLAAVESWLQSKGFTINRVGAGKTAIEFSGTAGEIKSAFHTAIHIYKVNGEIHHANATNPQVPAALSPVIAGIGSLNDFYPRSQVKAMGSASYSFASHKITPQWTTPNGAGGVYYAVSPEDFATQYDLTPLYKAGTTGAGQTIGIINDSNIDLGLVAAYRKLYGLDGTSTTPNLPHVIVDGDDPGIDADSIEAYLDVELSGAVAPQATINLYIAADTDLNDGVDLAILRAVEDDTATVLSLSFSECEADLGASGMAYYNSIWEQAAAQGQTVTVAAGDNGSAGCDNDNTEADAADGLQVNGLASTPWNIAVGGTDFFYSDYATGGASTANYWNTQNDASLGSLKSPIPEQAWNDSQYGLNILSNGSDDIVGTGGGQSTCAIPGGPLAGTNALTSSDYCTGLGGFPKPVWQSAPGVPTDQVRDLPDVSLFAANGINYSFYAICANPGDCANTNPATGDTTFYGVGGTSASSPAFAGIMVLVNQKYGAQGQADFILYPLATKMPSVFHDVTAGTNNVPCDPTNPGLQCSEDGAGGYSLQKWPTTTGYDLATGLGSVDANALVTNWNSISLSPATMVFTASPTSITHGQTVTLNTSVAASSGSDTPTGSVAVIADTILPANKGQTLIPLDATGAGTTSINFLPGGTYNLYGRYSGDSTFASSQSTPVSVTVSPENSVIQVSAFQNQTSPYPPQTNLQPSIPYGTPVGIDLQINGVNAPAGTIDGVATGTVTYMDNGSPIATLPLNSNGASVYSSSMWTIGKHSITASYSGDPSYNASTTNPAAPVVFTVGQGQTTMTLTPSSEVASFSGGNLEVQATVQALEAGTGGLPPTGNVVITVGTQTQTVALSPGISPAGVVQGTATATFSAADLQPGFDFISATYGGDSNWTGSQGQSLLINFPQPTNSTISLALTSPSDPSTIQPGTPVTFVATVTAPAGSTAAPIGLVQFVTDGYLFGPDGGEALVLTPGTGTTSTATFTFTAYEGLSGSNQFYAVYTEGNYPNSTSNVLTFNNSSADFSILTNNPAISIASGSTGTASLTFSSINQFSGNITLSCAVTGGPSGNTILPTCSVPASVAVSSTGQAVAAVQFNTAASSTSKLAPSPSLRWGAGGTTFACLLLLGIPACRRKWRVTLGLFLVVAFSGSIIGCGGGSSSTKTGGTGNPPPPTSPSGVPTGTYTAVITATNGTTTHNVAIAIAVQ